MSSRRSLLRQSRLAADLQTSPQASALRQLLRDAVSNYALGVHQARGASHIVATSAQRQIAPTQGYFDDAQRRIQQNLAAVGLDPSKNPVAQADLADTLNRLATTGAQAKSELVQRGQDAKSGLQFQVNNLANQLASSQDKIGQQYADLAGQKGKLAESTYLTLANQEAGRALTRRGQNLSHSDRQAALDATQAYHSATLGQAQQRIDISKSKGKSHGGYTPAKVKTNTSKAQAEVNKALTWLKRGAPTDQLLTGSSVPHQMNYTDPATGKTKTRFTQIKVPQVDQIYVQAAHDLQRFGFLSSDTVHKLRTSGIHAETIGKFPPRLPRRTSPHTGRNPGERPH